jgi:multidrug efflux pump subunit AcrA (membrane-fusion protein)
MKRVTLWLVGVSLVLLAAGGTYAFFRTQGGVGGNSASTGTPPAQPLPVTAGVVVTKDFMIYRVGLGTVQAYNTVTIKVRVDGEIQKIAFHEGQDVRTGDLLAHASRRCSSIRRTIRSRSGRLHPPKGRSAELVDRGRACRQRIVELHVHNAQQRCDVGS